jgi:hypothetical protein
MTITRDSKQEFKAWVAAELYKDLLHITHSTDTKKLNQREELITRVYLMARNWNRKNTADNSLGYIPK